MKKHRSTSRHITNKQWADWLNTSIPFSVWKWSTKKHVIEARDFIFKEIGQEFRLSKDKDKDKAMLLVILLNLWVGLITGSPIQISLNANKYSKNGVYSRVFFTYKRTIRLLEELERRGYLQLAIGYFTEEHSRETRIWGTEKLIRLFVEEYKFQLIGDVITEYPNELVQLRNEISKEVTSRKTGKTVSIKKRIPVEFEDTESTLQMKANLKNYKSLAQSQIVTVKLESENFVSGMLLINNLIEGLSSGSIKLSKAVLNHKNPVESPYYSGDADLTNSLVKKKYYPNKSVESKCHSENTHSLRVNDLLEEQVVPVHVNNQCYSEIESQYLSPDINLQHPAVQSEYLSPNKNSSVESKYFSRDTNLQHPVIQSEYLSPNKNSSVESKYFSRDTNLQHPVIQSEYLLPNKNSSVESKYFSRDTNLQHPVIQSEYLLPDKNLQNSLVRSQYLSSDKNSSIESQYFSRDTNLQHPAVESQYLSQDTNLQHSLVESKYLSQDKQVLSVFTDIQGLMITSISYKKYKYPTIQFNYIEESTSILDIDSILACITNTQYSQQWRASKPDIAFFLYLLLMKKLFSLIKIKGKNKKLREEKRNELLNTKRKLIDFGIKNLEFDIEKKYLHRVFNRGSLEFDKGGRNYGALYQGLHEDVRSCIHINGNKTTEVDFSGMHIRMLYHQLNQDYKIDPYAIGSKEERTKYKFVSLISINAAKKEAAAAIRQILDKNNIDYGSGKGCINKLIENYKEFHEPIKEYLFTSAGIDLQNTDSMIMEEILMELHQRGILGLPIHDSVIVEAQHEELLKDLMMQAYRKFMDFEPVLKVA